MNLFYREYGAGPPLIILHGLIGSSDNWLPQAKMLGEKYHVFVIDQRNHGQSPHSDLFNYELMVEDIRRFIDDKKLDKPIVLGHSMGGKVAMNLAMGYQDLVSKLIVVDIAPKAYEVKHDHIVEGLKAIPIDVIQSRNEADAVLARYVSSVAVRQFLLKNLQRKTEGGFSWKLNLTAIDRNMGKISEGLFVEGTFEKDTLFVRGLKSDYIVKEDIKTIKKFFPNAQLVDMDTDHWVQAENPEAFVNVVLEFLKPS